MDTPACLHIHFNVPLGISSTPCLDTGKHLPVNGLNHHSWLALSRISWQPYLNNTLFNSLYFICIHFSDAKIVILISCIGNFSKKLPIVYQLLTVIEKKQGFFPAFFGSGNAMHRVPTVSPPCGAHPLQRPLQWPAVNFQFIDIQLLSGA